MRSMVLVVVLCAAHGCGDSDGTTDGGASDTGSDTSSGDATMDTAARDSGGADTTTMDSGATDTGAGSDGGGDSGGGDGSTDAAAEGGNDATMGGDGGGADATADASGDGATDAGAADSTVGDVGAGDSGMDAGMDTGLIVVDPPVLTAASPAAPSDDNSPHVTGTGLIDGTVRLYNRADCGGTEVASGTVNGSGDFDIAVSVADNTQTTFYATVEDGDGNVSACSDTFVTYVEQSPSSIPSVAGVIDYAGAETGRIYIRLRGTCTGNCPPIGGTSIPGPGPYLIRGVQGAGNDAVLEAWMDVLGVQQLNAAADPADRQTVTLPASPVSDWDLTLVDPSPTTPDVPSDIDVFGLADAIVVSWDRVHDPGDPQGYDLAESYVVTCSDVVSPGGGDFVTTRTATGSGADFVIVRPLSPGDYYCTVEAFNAAGGSGPSAPLMGTLAAAGAGATVTGDIVVPAEIASGTLFVIAQDATESLLSAAAVSATAGTVPYTLTGVADGTYELLLIVDRDDDGHIALDDIQTFHHPEGGIFTVSGGDTTAPTYTLPGGPDHTYLLTQNYVYPGGSDPKLALFVWQNRGIPVRVSVDLGAEGVFDVGLEGGGGDESFRLDHQYGSLPTAGTEFPVELEFADGSTVVRMVPVTGVFDSVPGATEPVGASAGLTPTFTWTAPASGPAVHRYGLVVDEAGLGGSVWDVRLIGSATLSVVYDFNGTASQPALTAATSYSWLISAHDAYGNVAMRSTSFDTP